MFWCGDGVLYRVNLKKWIREAKAAYRRKIEDGLQNNNYSEEWQRVQHITGYRPSNFSASDGDVLLAEINHFFTQFEVLSLAEATKHPLTHSSHMWGTHRGQWTQGNLWTSLHKHWGKAEISYLSFSPRPQRTSPCPLPEKTTIRSLNDYPPVAQTPVIMKWSVRSHITSNIPPSLDPFQFA